MIVPHLAGNGLKLLGLLNKLSDVKICNFVILFLERWINHNPARNARNYPRIY
jgi:hypothetical protein